MKENNERKSLYEQLDSGIMYSVNLGVQAWNWTTGKTRADLANLLNMGYISLVSAGIIASPNSSLSSKIIFPSIVTLIGIHTFKRNQTMDREEISAALNSVKNPIVESQKKNCELNGILNTCAGSVLSLRSENIYESTGGIGIISFGLGHYVMRADYLPPRKNCVSRGLEKLTKELSILNPSPVTQSLFLNYEAEK